MRIGLYDSGVGGLTVLSVLYEMMPEQDYIYFGDTAHAPYGNRSEEEIRNLSFQAVNQLMERGAEVVVVACNSSASTCFSLLQRTYAPIPFFNLIESGVTAALHHTNGKVGMIATKRTVESGRFAAMLHQFSGGRAEMKSLATPELVPLIEKGVTEPYAYRSVLSKYLEPLNAWGMDTLILGCTHYPLIASVIQEHVPQVKLVDPACALAKRMADDLCLLPKGGGNVTLMASGSDQVLARYWDKLQSKSLSASALTSAFK